MNQSYGKVADAANQRTNAAGCQGNREHCQHDPSGDEQGEPCRQNANPKSSFKA